MNSTLSRSAVGQLLERRIRDRGRDVALVSEAEKLTWTFTQLGEAVDGWIRRLGEVEPGRMVALLGGNSAAFVAQFFALRALGAAVLLTDVPAIAERLSAVKVPAGTALIKLTSGSTQSPRGACFTEEALVEGIDHIVRGMDLTKDDRVLISIPLSHGYGFDNGVLSLAAAGTPLVLQPDVLPGALLRTLREREITFFPAVPALLRALGQVTWPAAHPLKRVISASAPLSKDVADQFTRVSGVPVQQFLGSTETGGISFETRPTDPAAEGAVGFPLPGVRIELVDGAVRVHSKANRFALIPEQPVADYVDTGDRAEFTPEGRLKLLGRATLTANVGGHKVDLGALDAFFRGLKGVDDALSLPMEDAAAGERVVVYVESRVHTPVRLMELCREKLSAREVPGEIRVMERLPRNARGKLDRAALAGASR